MKTVLVLGHDGMGHGDTELGVKILGVFLRKSPVLKKLRSVLLFNSGVKLVVEGSPVLPELHQLDESGIEIHPCGTCLDHFGLREKVVIGETSNMDALIAEMNQADKVIAL
jgi:hypothetical protein